MVIDKRQTCPQYTQGVDPVFTTLNSSYIIHVNTEGQQWSLTDIAPNIPG